jgi:hypothetical protein
MNLNQTIKMRNESEKRATNNEGRQQKLIVKFFRNQVQNHLAFDLRKQEEKKIRMIAKVCCSQSFDIKKECPFISSFERNATTANVFFMLRSNILDPLIFSMAI